MNQTEVREIASKDKQSVQDFVRLERKFIGSHPLYVAYVDADSVKWLMGQSVVSGDMEHAMFVASNGSNDVARCAAFINRRYQQAKDEAVGFIGFFAAQSDHGAQVAALFDRAEDWLSQRGVTRVIAPYNGSALQNFSLLTADFDKSPMFPYTWNPPYYGDYLIDCGYRPTYPFWYYTVDFTSDDYQLMAGRALKNQAATVRPIDKKHWDRDIEAFRQILNTTFVDEWEVHQFGSDEIRESFDPYKPVFDTNHLLLAEKDGKPVGFCWGVIDLNPLFRSFKGKLGPLQIIRMLFSVRRYKRAGLLMIGVLPEYKGSGIAQKLVVTLYKYWEKRGLREAFYFPVNESNLRSRRFAERLGGSGQVLYHCYDKLLN